MAITPNTQVIATRETNAISMLRDQESGSHHTAWTWGFNSSFQDVENLIQPIMSEISRNLLCPKGSNFVWKFDILNAPNSSRNSILLDGAKKIENLAEQYSLRFVKRQPEERDSIILFSYTFLRQVPPAID